MKWRIKTHKVKKSEWQNARGCEHRVVQMALMRIRIAILHEDYDDEAS